MNRNKQNRGLFTCLVGTLIEKQNQDEVISVDNYKFKAGVLSKLRVYLTELDYQLIIVTNMPEINEGKIKPAEASELINDVFNNIAAFCSNSPLSMESTYVLKPLAFVADYAESPLAKPAALAAIESAKKGISLSDSIMVGDGGNDGAFAEKAGIKTYYDISEFVK